jgi:hypothetical protein
MVKKSRSFEIWTIYFLNVHRYNKNVTRNKLSIIIFITLTLRSIIILLNHPYSKIFGNINYYFFIVHFFFIARALVVCFYRTTWLKYSLTEIFDQQRQTKMLVNRRFSIFISKNGQNAEWLLRNKHILLTRHSKPL